MKKRTTLRDVAKKANVHFTTVALAVRGDSRVNAKTAERILAVVKQLDYRPDPMLSALADYRTRRRRVFHGNLGYIFTPGAAARDPGFRTAYLAAHAHADRSGFRIDSFELPSKPGGVEHLQRVLQARGIQGLILSPLYSPGPYATFDWRKFCVATIRQSITSPLFNRACNHQAHAMRQLIARLRALGYRRIWLVLSDNATLRTEHVLLGTYCAEQHFSPAEERLSPLVLDEIGKSAFASHLRRAKPDCIIASEPGIYDRCLKLGYAIPRDLGFSLAGFRTDRPEIAGPVENWEMLGEAAVDILIALLRKRGYGIPASPMTTLVENNLELRPKRARPRAHGRRLIHRPQRAAERSRTSTSRNCMNSRTAFW